MTQNGHSPEWKKADWFATLVRRALRETDDADLALRSAEMAIAVCPFPDETEIDRPGDDPDDDWREEAEPIGTSDGKPVDGEFSWEQFRGKRGGMGWRSNITGEIRYQRERPSEREERPQQTGQQRGQTPSDVAGASVLQAQKALDTNGRNFVSLVDLRKQVPNLTPEQFNAAVAGLRRQGKLELAAAEGRHGIGEQEQAAGIKEEGQLLLYAKRLQEPRQEQKGPQSQGQQPSQGGKWTPETATSHLKGLLSGIGKTTGTPQVDAALDKLGELSKEEVDTVRQAMMIAGRSKSKRAGIDEIATVLRQQVEMAAKVAAIVGRPPAGMSLDASFAYDIFDREAQGILNRAMKAAKSLSAQARRELDKILSLPSIQAVSHKLEDWGVKYRNQLATLLSRAQLASLLTGMKQVAQRVPPTLPRGVPNAELPASLSPEEAIALLERLREMGAARREVAIYELPPEQQGFARTALAAEGGHVTPPVLGDKEFPIIDEAARILSQKRLVTRPEFDRLDDVTRSKAFTVASVTSEETLGKIRDTLTEQINQGVDYKEFRERILAEVEPATFLSEGHMENVFRTNIQSALSDGQMEVLAHPFVKSGFPYADYNAIHDDRVRENHLALENLGIDSTNVYRQDDPVFQRFRPPWDYMDRCNWNPLSIRQAAEKGVKEAQEWLRTGVEPSPPAFVSSPPFEPPPSFRRALMEAPLSIRLSMESLGIFGQEKDEEEAPNETPAHGQGGRDDSRDDFDRWSGKAAKKMERKVPRLRGKKRKLGKGLRQSKKWWSLYEPGGASSANLSTTEETPDPPAISTGNVVPAVPTSDNERKSVSGGDKSVVGLSATASNAPTEIGVANGWGPLKAVVVGIPDNDVLPVYYPNKDNKDGNELDLDASRAGLLKREAAPEKFKKCVEQMDAFCELLEKEGVQVFRPPLTPVEIGKDQPVGLAASWVREAFTVFGKTIVQNQTRAPHRRKELAALTPFLERIARTVPGAKLLRLPPVSDARFPDWEHDNRPFLEGGDIRRLGKDVIVGMSYLASSPTGFRWLANALEPEGWEVHPAYLTMDWLHLDYALATVKEGLCLAYLPAFKDKLLPSPITDWDVVELTKDETNKRMCGNTLALRPGTVMVPNCSRRLMRLLERKNLDVIDVEYDAVTFFQGGLDCSTNELLRG